MKKILTVILSLVGSVLLALGATGCGPTVIPHDESKYTGFNVAEALVLERGQFYEIANPIAMDVYGNVLGITVDVVDSQGNPAGKFLPSGFFALDTNGYTITYSTALPNGQSLVKSTKVYVLEYTKDTDFHPVDRFLDLRSYVPSPMPAGYEAVYTVTQKGSVIEGAVSGGTVLGQNLEEGSYSVNISLSSATNTFNLRDMDIDVGNTNSPVWRVGELNASDVQVEDYYNVLTDSVEVVDAAKGEVPGKSSGKYYKIDPSAEQVAKYEQFGLWIKPMYSESYYNSFVGQGYKIKFSFRLALPAGATWKPLTVFSKDLNADAVQTFSLYAHYATLQETIAPDVTAFDWIDVELSLDKVVADYMYLFTTVTGDTRAFFLDLPRGHVGGYRNSVTNVDQTTPQDIIVYMSSAVIEK